MIYVLSAVHRTIDFCDVQAEALERWLPVPYRVHVTVSGLRPAQLRKVTADLVLPGSTNRRGQWAHAENLNALAADVCQVAADSDLMIFLDSDAWPIGPVLPFVRASISDGAALVAVRRAENLGEPQPHPLFCAITVGMWRAMRGDWRPGYKWTNTEGREWTDTGANMIPALAGRPWVEILRSNTVNPHPVFFAVYGELIYHHGAGSRIKICRSDRAVTGNDRQMIKDQADRNAGLSAQIRAEIAADPVGFWRRFVAHTDAHTKGDA